MKITHSLTVIVIAVLLLAPSAQAQDKSPNFYNSQTMISVPANPEIMLMQTDFRLLLKQYEKLFQERNEARMQLELSTEEDKEKNAALQRRYVVLTEFTAKTAEQIKDLAKSLGDAARAASVDGASKQ